MSGRALALTFAVVSAAAACDIARDRPALGYHEAGWTDAQSASFHGKWLAANGYPLAECRTCHGEDYAGGGVGVSCEGSGCHAHRPDACGTCHGDGDLRALPKTGAHAAHETYCDDCHSVPASVAAPGHINGHVEIAFSGLAITGGAMPAFDLQTQRCTSTYCHGATSPAWNAPVAATCDTCHGAPPPSHARYGPPEHAARCDRCHPSGAHLDGKLELRDDMTCASCHGQDASGAPPPALDGSFDPEDRGVGAHQRHLDPTLVDRIGRVAACTDCHDVPASILAPGHLDASAPADVHVTAGGSYDVANATCVAWCHFDRDPGPRWTDDSGAARACDACHGFPPTVTRTGTIHPVAAPDLSVCITCHVYDPSTHVDGKVDMR